MVNMYELLPEILNYYCYIQWDWGNRDFKRKLLFVSTHHIGTWLRIHFLEVPARLGDWKYNNEQISPQRELHALLILGMTLNCIHIFIVTGSFLYWCGMRLASQRFFIGLHSCIFLRILIISYLATFLGTYSLSVLMCRKAVDQSINLEWDGMSIASRDQMLYFLMNLTSQGKGQAISAQQ